MPGRVGFKALALLPPILVLLLSFATAGGANDASVGDYGYPPIFWGSVHTAPESGVCPGENVTIYGDGAVPGSQVTLGLNYWVPQPGARQATAAGVTAGDEAAGGCYTLPGENAVFMTFGTTTADGDGAWSFTGTVPTTVTTNSGATVPTYPGDWDISSSLPSGISTGIHGSLTVLDCQARGKLPATGLDAGTSMTAVLLTLAGLSAVTTLAFSTCRRKR